jgi:hypothetical protein
MFSLNGPNDDDFDFIRRFFVRDRLPQGLWILLLTTILAFPVYGSEVANIDLWTNLMTGKYLSLFNSFPHYSTFTTVPVKEYVGRDAVDWLGQFVLYGIYRSTGSVGLSLIKFGPLLVLYAVTLRLIPDVHWSVPVVVLVLLSYGIAGRVMARSSLFGLYFLPGLLYCWHRFVLQKSFYHLWMLPPLLVLWSNLHGSYLVGLAILLVMMGTFLVGELLTSSWEVTREVQSTGLALLLTCAGVNFVKPFLSLTSFVWVQDALTRLKSLSMGKGMAELTVNYNVIKALSHDILVGSKFPLPPEFVFSLRELSAPEDYLAFFLLWPVCLIALIFLYRSLPPSFLTGSVLAVWIGLSAQRAVAYSNLAIGILLIPAVIDECLQPKIRFPGLNTEGSARTLITVFCLIFILCFGAYGTYLAMNGTDAIRTGLGFHWTDWRLGIGLHPKFQTKIPDHIVNNYPEANIYNDVYPGSVLLFEIWPYKRVFWWPEFTIYGEETLRRFGQMDAIAGRFQTGEEVIVVLRSSKLRTEARESIKSMGWRLILKDQLMSLFAFRE